jgi:hypothetical protein
MHALSNWSPRQALKTLNARKKELFGVWIAYQSIKGLITTSLIWVPLIMLWLGQK